MGTQREKFMAVNSGTMVRNKGFTLIELMIVGVIIAIGLALAVPTYQDTVQKRRVTAAAESIASFLTLVQGEAIKRNETIAISVKRASSGATWCAGAMIRTAATDHCDCEETTATENDHCDFNPGGAGDPRVINHVGFESFTMNSSRAGALASNDFNFNFDPVRGVKVLDSGLVDGNSHQVTLLSKNTKYSLLVDISVTGRIRVCNPDSNKKVPGFKSCALIVAPPPIPLPF